MLQTLGVYVPRWRLIRSLLSPCPRGLPFFSNILYMSYGSLCRLVIFSTYAVHLSVVHVLVYINIYYINV